jgi:hypothetical protein
MKNVGLARAAGYDGGMENNPYESPTASDPPIKPEPPPRGLTAPEVFGVAARGIGLYFLVCAIFELAVYAIPHDAALDMSRYWHLAVANLIAGFIPFFAPDLLVKLTYRERRLD